jgi:AraC-like DNA-binding protein
VFGETVFCAQLEDVVISKTSYEPGMLMGAHVHERAYVSFVTEGRYTEHSREVPRHLHRNMFVFHPAGEVHADCVHDQSMATLNIEYLSGDLPRAFFAAGGREVEALTHRFLTALPPSGPLLREALAAIAGFLDKHVQRDKPSEPVRRARAMLQDAQPPKIAEIASRIGMHRVTLHRAFKRTYGESLRDESIRSRLSVAATLLTGSEDSVAGIAVACGYFDQSHFCRQFKRFAGMAPSAYRRAFRSP